MSRSEVIGADPKLRSAALEVVKACGPALARVSRSMLDSDQAQELDRAKQSLLDLAKALESAQ